MRRMRALSRLSGEAGGQGSCTPAPWKDAAPPHLRKPPSILAQAYSTEVIPDFVRNGRRPKSLDTSGTTARTNRLDMTVICR